jgi:antiphage defense system Thoeris ThsB-like protein
MPRKVFFSFHYERDGQRASVVRNSWVTKGDEAGYIDAVKWEEVKGRGDAAIRRWIEEQLDGTSVTVVLIGAETSSRDWVKYEIQRSYSRGNGMLGIYLHNIKDFKGNTDLTGNNQFGPLGTDATGNAIYFWSIYSTYDWVLNNGYDNLGTWIEEAAKKAGR